MVLLELIECVHTYYNSQIFDCSHRTNNEKLFSIDYNKFHWIVYFMVNNIYIYIFINCPQTKCKCE